MTLRLTLQGRTIVKKNSQQIFKSKTGRPFITPGKRYQQYAKEAIFELMLQAHGMCFRNAVRVTYTFYMKGKIESDLDNMIASINDILKGARVLEDDKLITEIVAIKIPGCRAFETQIEIEGSA